MNVSRKSFRRGLTLALLMTCLSLWVHSLSQANQSYQAAAMLEISGQKITLPVQVEQDEALSQWMMNGLETQTKHRRLVLTLKDLEYSEPAHLFHEIYLNLPSDVETQNRKPQYVGNLSVYAFPQGADYTVDISRRMKQYLEQHQVSDFKNISVTFSPANVQGETAFDHAPTIRFKEISLSVRPK